MNINKKPVAVLDLDDTLINTREAMYECIKKRYGKEYLRHWSEWTDFKMEANSNIDVNNLIEHVTEDRLFEKIEPHPHSAFFLRDLAMRGYYVVIVTAREGFVPNPYDTTEWYLRKHDIDYDELIISKHGQSKVDFLKNFDTIDFTIDDQVHNCEDFENSGKVNNVFLHALPHNKQCTMYVRLHSPYQVYNHLGLE